MERQILTKIRQDLKKKIVLVSGPRQCGKTTLSKMLSLSYEYLNFDNIGHRKIYKEQSIFTYRHIYHLINFNNKTTY